MCKFKVGDKVMRTVHSYEVSEMFIGNIYTIEKINTDGWLTFKENKHGWWNPLNFELVQPKQFTKSDLRDGMRVVYRDGSKRLIINKELYQETQTGNYEWVVATSVFNDELMWLSNPICDIMRVIDRDGVVLFERVEKSQQEIEMDKLQKQIADLQEQANKLKDTM